jgi:hypothetical protein
MISGFSFLAGFVVGRLVGLKSKKFKGLIKGRRNLRLVKKDE